MMTIKYIYIHGSVRLVDEENTMNEMTTPKNKHIKKEAPDCRCQASHAASQRPAGPWAALPVGHVAAQQPSRAARIFLG
jgi:hypothetical protein